MNTKSNIIQLSFLKYFLPSVIVIAHLVIPCSLVHAKPYCTVSNSGNLVAYVCRDDSGNKEYVSIWDVSTGKEKRRLIGNTPGSGLNEGINHIVFGKNENYLVEWSHLGIKVWDATTGEVLNEIKEKMYYALISSDGDFCILPPIMERDTDGTVKFESNGFRVMSLPELTTKGYLAPGFTTFDIENLTLSQDNSQLYVCSSKSTNGMSDGKKSRLIYSLDNYRLLKELPANKYSVNKVFFNKDYVFELLNGKVIIKDAHTLTEVRQITIKNKGYEPSKIYLLPHKPESLFIKESYYTSSSYLLEYNLSTGELLHEYPLKMQDKIRVESNIAFSPTGSFICWCNDKNRLNLHKIVNDKNDSSGHDVQFISYTVNRRSSALIDDLKLMSRSKALKEIHETLTDNNGWWKIYKEDPVTITNALTHLRTPVTTRSDVSPIDKSKPRLFILTVGVSKHEYKEYNLNCCSNDALVFHDRIKQEHGSVYGDVQTQFLLNKVCTKEKLKESLEWLKRSSTPNDIVMVFFAGHGIKGKKGLYYFTYHGDEENIHSTCYNWGEIAQVLAQTQAKQIMFIADCCHAGSFSKEHYAPQKQQYEEIQKADNITILASCGGNEFSEENTSLKHGVFTYYLIEGLNGAADSNHDKSITWHELTEYVVKIVPAQTNDRQHPLLIKDNISTNNMVIATCKNNKLSTQEKSLVLPQ